MINIFIAIRGATTTKANTKEEIVIKTKELLLEIVKRNNIDTNNIVSAFFTLTNDLNAEFPAVAARDLGWTEAALMCARELDIPGSLPKCIRVLVHCVLENFEKPKHVYLHDATKLRSDIEQL